MLAADRNLLRGQGHAFRTDQSYDAWPSIAALRTRRTLLIKERDGPGSHSRTLAPSFRSTSISPLALDRDDAFARDQRLCASLKADNTAVSFSLPACLPGGHTIDSGHTDLRTALIPDCGRAVFAF